MMARPCWCGNDQTTGGHFHEHGERIFDEACPRKHLPDNAADLIAQDDEVLRALLFVLAQRDTDPLLWAGEMLWPAVVAALKGERMMTRRIDPEIKALRAIRRAIDPLDLAARWRVAKWLLSWVLEGSDDE
jgi:hypothetical protein